MVSPFAVVSAVATALGSYHLGSAFVRRGRRIRQKAKELRENKALLKEAVVVVKNVKGLLADGLDDGDIAKVRAEIARLKAVAAANKKTPE